jgi:hypothetical protein
LREPWIKALFAQPRSLVAVRLDTAPLPGACAQIIDMQAWPARSADRKVGTLVHWLQHGDDVPPSASRSPPPRAGATGTGPSRPQRWQTGMRVGDRTRNILAVIAVITVIGLGGLLLSLAVPDTDRRVQRSDPVADVAAERPTGREIYSSTSTEVDPPPLSVSPAGAPSTRTSAAEDPSGSAVLLRPRNTQVLTQQADRRVASADQGAREPPSAIRSDALSHLCQAGSVDAARAWAGVLNWKQRGRLAGEPCIVRLIRRPGFEELERLLDLP